MDPYVSFNRPSKMTEHLEHLEHEHAHKSQHPLAPKHSVWVALGLARCILPPEGKQYLQKADQVTLNSSQLAQPS